MQATRPLHNLPAQISTFVGRKRELTEVARLLAEHRLVTLTGVGGSGKTRLGLEVAIRELESSSDGIWLVELGSLTKPDLVPRAVIAALGIPERSDRRPMDILIDHLQDRDVFLVLDNCEHLVDGCAATVQGLLRASSSLRVLTTSRAPLGVGGEVIYPVPPLHVPGPEEPPEELARSDSVQLFLDRVAGGPAHLSAPEALPVAARICRDLDGLPLAIEIAAARARAMSLEDVAGHLGDRFRFLRYWSRTAIPRHQTLEAAIDWSFDLLGDEERVVLRRLSCFAGGFTLEGVRSVALEGAGEDQVLDVLTRLVDASLIVAEAQDGKSRYRLLETVRQYAADRLGEAGEAKDARRRHASYFLGLAERAWEAKDTAEEGAWLARLETEHDNLRGALEWSFRDGDPNMGVRLVRALGRFWQVLGHYEEGQPWLERALGHGEAPPDIRADLLGTLGYLHRNRNDLPQAKDLLEQAVRVAREGNAPWSAARWLNRLSWIWWWEGDYPRARSLAEESLALQKELGDIPGMSWSVGTLADMATYEGRLEDAEEHFRQALTLAREAGTPSEHMVSYASSFAALQLIRGRYEVAQRSAEEGLALARSLGDRLEIGRCLLPLAEVARLNGEIERARVLLAECLETLWSLRAMRDVADSIETLARVAVDGGETLVGARLLAGAATIRGQFHAAVEPVVRAGHEEDVQRARAALGHPSFEEAWQAGRAMSPEEAVRFALDYANQPAETPPPPPDRASLPGPTFLREAEYWSIAYMEDRFRLRDTKGLRYLALLLSQPGREFHSVDLVAIAHGSAAPARRSPGRLEGLELPESGDAGEILDVQAKETYRRRLHDLEEELEEAESFSDSERAARAKHEMQFLVQELSRAVGLGGRDRKAASAAERARQAVSKAIKAAIERIAHASPSLGRHLAATIHTGTFCSYTPDPRVPLTWRT
jgi:predicted ATPase